MNRSLAGRVAVVTGAATGIGRASARLLAERGARVCIADINLEGAETAAEVIRAEGGEAMAVKLDVSREADNAALAEKLASDAASFITGAVYPVDGGMPLIGEPRQ